MVGTNKDLPRSARRVKAKALMLAAIIGQACVIVMWLGTIAGIHSRVSVRSNQMGLYGIGSLLTSAWNLYCGLATTVGLGISLAAIILPRHQVRLAFVSCLLAVGTLLGGW